MNMTKDYIELCKCKEVQELRPEIKCGDYCINTERNHMFLNTEDYEPGRKEYRKNLIWLPRSDQLDEEIIKIVKTKEETINYDKIDGYSFFYDKEFDDYEAWITDSSGTDYYLEDDKNPLIAKIKLLLELSKE